MVMNKVETTKNYEMFKFLGYNRDIDEKRVSKIAEVIKKRGFLVPILVNQDNYVVDGQHRLSAATNLNVDVVYMRYKLSDSDLPHVISEMNSVMKTWTLEEYQNLWSERGLETYVYLDSKFSDSILSDFTTFYRCVMVSGGGHSKGAKFFRDGSFTLTASQRRIIEDRLFQIEEIFNMEIQFKDFGSSFLNAVASCVVSKKYKHIIMINALKLDAGRLMRAQSKIDFQIQLEGLYNKYCKKSERIKFVSQK